MAAWRWVVGIQPVEDLPNIATDALVRDLDTPALRELAGAAKDDFWLIRDSFERTIGELWSGPARRADCPVEAGSAQGERDRHGSRVALLGGALDLV